MATKKYRGDAQPVAQVSTITVGGTWANGDMATVTCNLKDVTVTFGNGAPTTAQVAAAVKAALAGDDVTSYGETRNDVGTSFAEMKEFAAGVSGSVVSLTAAAAGVPFTVSVSKSSASGTFVLATPTASSGPYHYDAGENWDPVNVPVDGDDIVFEKSSAHVRYGLDQSSVTPASVTFESTMTGDVGLPDNNPLGYYEYRQKKLTFDGATAANFPAGDGAGSPRVRLDFGTGTAVTANVSQTGTSAESGVPAVRIDGANAGNVLNLLRGSVGLAFDDGASANFPTVRCGAANVGAGESKLFCGAGCSLTTITNGGSDLTTNANVTTVTMTGGSHAHLAGTVGTVTCDGGTFTQRSTGTVTTGTFRGPAARLDASRDLRGKTFTNLSVTKGAVLYDPNKVLTFTNPVSLDRESLKVSDLGATFSLQRS